MKRAALMGEKWAVRWIEADDSDDDDDDLLVIDVDWDMPSCPEFFLGLGGP